MPYAPHPSLNTPDDQTILWRYLDGVKLADLLLHKWLFFPSGRLLQERYDRFEGTPTFSEIEKLNREVSSLTLEEKQEFPDVADEVIDEGLKVERAYRKVRAAHISESCFFNCWHMNDTETDAMWKIYAHSYGCAVVSTVGKLKAAIAKDGANVFLHKMLYSNPDECQPRDDIFVRPYLRKLKAFAHESELRAFVFDPRKANNAGITVCANPVALIDRIVISPYAETWFLPSVAALTKALGYTFEIVLSRT